MPATIDEIMPEVSRLLAERAGIVPESFGLAGIAHAVRRRISAAGAASSQDYLRCLCVDMAEFQELLEDLVVPETWFFRDLLAFRCLARQLDAVRSGNPAVVRVLSVGCSTGEEVYSLAMAVREAGFTAAECFILGTDISRRALDLARKGTYTPRSFREPDEAFAALCQRWCEPAGELWQVGDELRAGVELRWGNLAKPDFLADEPPFDVIFCRNVLIYFHAEARRTAVGHLRRLLAPQGVLYSAPAEARIFSEAGFCSLGSACPFAFRHQDELGTASKVPAAVPGLQAKSQRFPGGATPPRAATLTPVVPRTSPLPLSLDDDLLAPTSGGNAISEEFVGEALLSAAKQAADGGRLDEAAALCGQVLSRNPASAEAHYLQGVVLQSQGMPSEAQRSLEKALYLAPRHYQTLVHMMLLAEQRGDQQAAANYRRRAQQTAPPEAQ